MKIVKNNLYSFSKKKFPTYNFFKIQSFQYNKKMRISDAMIKKEVKLMDDLDKMNDLQDFKIFALNLQSDLYHEHLFQNLSKIKFLKTLTYRIKFKK
jgi:hypothetical protein